MANEVAAQGKVIHDPRPDSEKICFRREGSRLIYHYDAEELWIEPWGKNSLRVRATHMAEMPQENWALTEPPETSDSKIEIHEDGSAEYVENEQEEENVVAEQGLREVSEEPRKAETVQVADAAATVQETDGQMSMEEAFFSQPS